MNTFDQNTREYKNYTEAREAVLAMLKNEHESSTSKYWQEELAGFEYMLEAPPSIIKNLRHHCYHISGLHEYDYRGHHQHKKGKIEKWLKALTAVDQNNLSVPESPALGGYGYDIAGAKYNGDTLSFYECLLAMQKSGILDGVRNNSGRNFALEIGAGWGGLAYQFKKLFPNTTYAIVDLPLTMIFSITYLKAVFPDAKILTVDGTRESVENLNKANLKEYDFIFIPHYVWNELKFSRPDLIINRASFQEMKAGEVESYVGKSKSWGVPVIYSMNRDRSPHNPEMTSVSAILANFYKIEEVFLLDEEIKEKSLWGRAKKKILGFITGKKGLPSEYVHRHIVGRI